MSLIRRLIAYMRVRKIEIELSDRQSLLSETSDALARSNVELEIHHLRKRLTKARGDYQVLFPPGHRFTWQQA